MSKIQERRKTVVKYITEDADIYPEALPTLPSGCLKHLFPYLLETNHSATQEMTFLSFHK